jgi:AbrB family looped-hinge helix DNA binding protein
MQVDAQGQITIPSEVRDRLGLATGTEVELEVVGEIIQLRKKSKPDRGKQLIEDLRGKAPFQESTDEIMGLTRGDD